MLTVGQTAPDFELPNQDGKLVKLSDYRGRKVVLFAFPRANTPGCNNQACSFRDTFPRIESANAVVLGISSDSPETLKEWKEMKNLQYDLLSDEDHKVLESWDAWGMKLLGIVSVPTAKRSFWVLDENGVVLDMQVSISPQDSVDKALAAVEAASQTAN